MEECDCTHCAELRKRAALFGNYDRELKTKITQNLAKDPFGLYPIIEQENEGVKKGGKGIKKNRTIVQENRKGKFSTEARQKF